MTVIVLLLFCVASLLAGGSASPNQLTAEEKAAGWVLLFDGESFAGWEGFNNTSVAPQSWGIDDGAIRTLADNSGGDMVTVRPPDYAGQPGPTGQELFRAGAHHQS